MTITGPVGGPAIDESLVADFGGVSDAVFLHCRDAWVPTGRLLALARALPDGYRLSATQLLDQAITRQGGDSTLRSIRSMRLDVMTM